MHFREDELAQQKCSAQVHGNNSIEFGERIVLDGNYGAVMAGVVDEDIDPAEFRSGFRNDASAISFQGEVGKRIVSSPTPIGYFFNSVG